MSDDPDRNVFIQSYIDDERDRCRSLVAALGKGGVDKLVLLYMIDQSYTVNEIDRARARYAATEQEDDPSA